MLNSKPKENAMKKSQKISKRIKKIQEQKEARDLLERTLIAKGWPHALHPDTEEALQRVDAAIFTGDPSETKASFNRLRTFVNRWMRELERCKQRLVAVGGSLVGFEPVEDSPPCRHARVRGPHARKA